jgi:hypothetical protein
LTAHVALDEKMFRTLVAGEIVSDSLTFGDDSHRVTLVVKILLSDIGFAVMRKAIDDAEREVEARRA